MKIQILELPAIWNRRDPDDAQLEQQPFAIIVSECNLTEVEYSTSGLGDFAKSAGARALLVTPDEVEVP